MRLHPGTLPGAGRVRRRRRVLPGSAQDRALPLGISERGLALALMVMPGLACLALLAAMVQFSCQILLEAELSAFRLPSLLPLFLALVAFTLVCALAAMTQSVRLAGRFAGPVRRLVLAMARVRRGDIGFRVHLRRGDFLTEVASEFNQVLDWLNENPPAGARCGGDVVDVHQVDPELEAFLEGHPAEDSLSPAEGVRK